MTARRSGWGDWVLTSAVLLAVAAGLWGLQRFSESGEAQRREESARVSRLVSLSLAGESAPVMVVMAGTDSISFPDSVQRPLLLYVRGPDCSACERMDKAMLEFLRTRRTGEPEVWVADEAGPRALGDTFGGRAGAHLVQPAQPVAFARRYKIEQVPYLALIDDEMRIQRVRVGFVRGFDVRAFLRGDAP